MTRLFKRENREYLFLGILAVLVFLLKVFNRHEIVFRWNTAIFVFNYLLAAIFINYFLLPKFLYKKRIWWFSFFLIIIISVTILIEEIVLEHLFFPNSRALRFFIIDTLVDVIPPLILMVGYKFSWDAIQKENRIETLNRMVAESELQFLNSQINPHFLFNNLNNLYSYALEKSPKTPGIILQLSSILRYMLYDCRDKKVMLSKEIENLKDYIKLSELQLGDEGKVTFNVYGEARQLRIAPLILMVFVENAFKHASASQLKNVQINISIKINNNILYFYCENNYTESSNTEKLDNGIGLKNVKGWLDLNYTNKYKLNIEPQNNWYKVFLKVELDNSEEK